MRAQRGMWGVKGDMGDRGGWGTEEEAPGMSGQVHSSVHGKVFAVGRGYPPPPEVDRGSPACAEPSGGPSWAGRPGLLPFSPQAYGGERLLSQHMSTPPWGPAGCCDREGQAGGLRKAGSTMDGTGGPCPVPGRETLWGRGLGWGLQCGWKEEEVRRAVAGAALGVSARSPARPGP